MKKGLIRLSLHLLRGGVEVDVVQEGFGLLRVNFSYLISYAVKADNNAAVCVQIQETQMAETGSRMSREM